MYLRCSMATLSPDRHVRRLSRDSWKLKRRSPACGVHSRVSPRDGVRL